jgi:ABC-type Fe3+ transport system substrate-binding protein
MWKDARPSRRALLAALPSALGASLLVREARAAADPLIVLTSFPEALTTRYEAEFEKAHPEFHVQFVWKQSRDALVELSKPDQGGVDVYWAPSLANFPVLRDRGAFRKLMVDRAVLPDRLGAQRLSDPQGMFEAYDLAGYGIVYDAAALARLGLAAPKRWTDLAAPALAGRIAMPIAGKVGFAPALYDIILQSEGWEGGWALIAEIAGGAELAGAGVGPTSAVVDGKAALGLTIDFLALGAQANGASVSFAYPERTAFLPGHIAIAAASRRPRAAEAFVEFALSTEGQKLLMEADSSRHPVRPDAYAGKAERIVDPFALPAGSFFDYDAEIGRRRPGLVSVLFDLAVAERHSETTAMWRAIHSAEARLVAAPDARTAEIVAKARRLAGAVPVPAAQASDPTLLERFRGREIEDKELAARWRAEIGADRAEATRLLASLEPHL